jgi:hypothetical protein
MKLYNGNPRRISKAQYKRLQETLDELGDLGGIVHDLNSDQIIGGNQRSTVFDVARMRPAITEKFDEPNKQGTVARGYVEWHGEKFAYRAVRWTDEQCRKGNIVANIAGGMWDWDALAGWDAAQLQEWGFDQEALRAWNSDAANLATMLTAEQQGSADAEPQIDRAAELNKKWQVKTGDLWRIGAHRLLCGDSTKREDVERVGITSRMPTFTDPPYGVDYDPRFLPEIAERHNKKLSSENKVINDDGSLDLSFLWRCDKRMVWGFPYIKSGDESGWIVWDKQPGVDKRGIVTPIEMAATTMRTGFDMVRVMWGGFYRAAGEDRQPHPTQKPIGVYSPFIESWTKQDDEIADYFAGSGPVLVACQNLQRKCRAIEISPNYCAVILERMATAFPGIEIERIL